MVYFPLRDFATLRIVCHNKDCGVVSETPIEGVAALMKKTGGRCPACDQPFTKPSVFGGEDVVTQAARVVIALNQLAGQVGLEFPVSAESA